ncbi:hypothetical protein [Vibrio coralliilyticus]|uniref:hypothetical protein n=1 Tax=Vibrio coralliilyticus TaxID=190893 RepID=UPI001E3016C7|nr:hypothetical protein [Vibrio coralliilyticus]MCC2525706.1 hypothetical protein [Vibrio coralliilyticus]
MCIRNEIIEEIRLLSSLALQTEYVESCAKFNAVAELFNGFCEDLYHPKDAEFLSAFNVDELKSLAHLYGVVSEASLFANNLEFKDLVLTNQWQRVMKVAQIVLGQLEVNT